MQIDSSERGSSSGGRVSERGKEAKADRRIFNSGREFDLDLENPDLGPPKDAPASEDADFDYINLDLEVLNKLKTSKFWDFVMDNVTPHSRFGEVLNIDKMMSYYPQFEEPLQKVKSELVFVVEKIFKWILKISESDPAQRTKNPARKIRKIIHIVLDKGEPLSTELYLTLIKFIRNHHPLKDERKRVEKLWHLMACVCSCVLPEPESLYPIYNYLVSVIDNHSEDYQREWARYCLKRLAMLEKNRYRRANAPGRREIGLLLQRKKFEVPIFLQNGDSVLLSLENYSLVEEARMAVLKMLNVPPSLWDHFHLLESVTKAKSLEERALQLGLMLGEVEASWELIPPGELKAARIYLAMKYYPFETDSLLKYIYFSKAYDLGMGKISLDKEEVAKLFALSLQIDFGNYVERPGFIKVKLRNYHHSFFNKFYGDEDFLEQVAAAYRANENKSANECMQIYLNGDKVKLISYGQLFNIRFKSSNNPNIKELQENLLLGVNTESISIIEEFSREKILELKFEEVMSWGLNLNVFVLCYGDKAEVTKLYFDCFCPYELVDCLLSYGRQISKDDSPLPAELEDQVFKYSTNMGVRKPNTFLFR